MGNKIHFLAGAEEKDLSFFWLLEKRSKQARNGK